ncbi:MAG: tripartite tricarboxylate transporter substrate binding protein [Actinobacteria bacterium]|nr:tripartite tricarboxylate transporter substrate binding protein [Actinomycetota bacterium]
MFKKKSLKLIGLVCMFVLVVFCAMGYSQSEDKWPEKEIKFIMVFDPGGGGDQLTMALKPFLEKALNTKIITEYKTGAGTQIAYEFLLQKPADGYTYAFLALPHLVNTIILQDPSYKLEDFYPLANITSDKTIWATRKDGKWNNMKELIEDARNRPREIILGVGSLTNELYLSAAILQEKAGVEFQIVPTGSGAKVTTGVLGGHFDVGLFRATSIIDIKDELKGLGVVGGERSIIFPDVASFDEQLPEKQRIPHLQNYFGLVVRSKFKEEYPERFEKFVAAVKDALNEEVYQKFLASRNQAFTYASPEEHWEEMLNLKEIMEEYKSYMEQ